MSGEEEVDLAPLVKSFTGFYLISTSDKDVSARLARDMKKFSDSNKYELYMEVSEDGEKMRIYSDKDGDNTLICIDGKILEDNLENVLAGMMKEN